jgi:predicted nucleotidyltransferase
VFKDLSIYVTGSYGRLEAGPQSDLDLFFVSEKGPPRRITQTLVDAGIIKIVRELGLPEFSNDGQYLEFHSLPEMLHQLGGREDDYKNFFTARLLLLLESRPLHNEAAYTRILQSIIGAYFRDYHDHVRDFRPIFLVNDILRFWKTLCLNYEKKRNVPPESTAEKNSNHVRNLKLKFSRLLICFSTVIPLAAMPHASPDEIFELTRLPPLERLATAARKRSSAKAIYADLVREYCWFLRTTTNPGLVSWMGERGNRRHAFRRADEFGALTYRLMTELLRDTDSFRFLII